MSFFYFIVSDMTCHLWQDKVSYVDTQACSVCQKDFCKSCIQHGDWVIEEDGHTKKIKPEEGSIDCEDFSLNFDIYSCATLYYICSDDCFGDLIKNLGIS